LSYASGTAARTQPADDNATGQGPHTMYSHISKVQSGLHKM